MNPNRRNRGQLPIWVSLVFLVAGLAPSIHLISPKTEDKESKDFLLAYAVYCAILTSAFFWLKREIAQQPAWVDDSERHLEDRNTAPSPTLRAENGNMLAPIEIDLNERLFQEDELQDSSDGASNVSYSIGRHHSLFRQFAVPPPRDLEEEASLQP